MSSRLQNFAYRVESTLPGSGVYRLLPSLATARFMPRNPVEIADGEQQAEHDQPSQEFLGPNWQRAVHWRSTVSIQFIPARASTGRGFSVLACAAAAGSLLALGLPPASWILCVAIPRRDSSTARPTRGLCAVYSSLTEAVTLNQLLQSSAADTGLFGP